MDMHTHSPQNILTWQVVRIMKKTLLEMYQTSVKIAQASGRELYHSEDLNQIRLQALELADSIVIIKKTNDQAYVDFCREMGGSGPFDWPKQSLN